MTTQHFYTTIHVYHTTHAPWFIERFVYVTWLQSASCIVLHNKVRKQQTNLAQPSSMA